MTAAIALTSPEIARILAPLAHLERVVVAVSGGSDSTALLWLMAQEKMRAPAFPDILAVTVDHGLRAESAQEAAHVGRLASSWGVAHQVLCWQGDKPVRGIQAAARAARYRLLQDAAMAFATPHVVTAHTRDDQAETILMRLAHGSGLSGLSGMDAVTMLGSIKIWRPCLDVEKARLVATLDAHGVPYVQDSSNQNTRFLRPRLRRARSILEAEGLSDARLARLGARMRRADHALCQTADAAYALIGAHGCLQTQGWLDLPEDVRIRVLARAIEHAGGQADRLNRLERLAEALSRGGRQKHTLGGIALTMTPQAITFAPEPARRQCKS